METNKILERLAIFGKFWQDKYVFLIFRINVLVLVIQFGYLLFFFNRLPPEVPLYYSLPWGVSQITSVKDLFILPIVSILILIVNNCLSILINENKLLSKILISNSLIISIFNLVTLVRIINLVS